MKKITRWNVDKSRKLKKEGEAINGFKKYSLKEVVEKGFIPGVTYCSLYNLVTENYKKDSVGGRKSSKRKLCSDTTNCTIKACQTGNAWNKISGKIYIEGEEIIKFKKINNL